MSAWCSAAIPRAARCRRRRKTPGQKTMRKTGEFSFRPMVPRSEELRRGPCSGREQGGTIAHRRSRARGPGAGGHADVGQDGHEVAAGTSPRWDIALADSDGPLPEVSKKHLGCSLGWPEFSTVGVRYND
jgi:hypothetical protein